jgi:hypothetical protein
MAFAGLDKTNADTPRRTEEGRKNISLTNPGTTEHPIRPAGCVGCANESAHGVCQWLAYEIPVGNTRNQYVDSDSAITLAKLNELQNAVFLAHSSIHGGAITNAPYNAGTGATGNNASFALLYEITSASGSTLSLRGANPKRILAGSTIPDPEWIPGSGDPRLVTNTFNTSLIAGAVVEFLAPSSLTGKIKPLIKRINVPASDTLDDVTFSVVCTAPIGAATEHLDAAYRANAYYCRIHWELNLPQVWLDLQAYKEAQWTVASVTVDAPGIVTLKNGLGSDTPVIYPSMGNLDANAFPTGGRH